MERRLVCDRRSRYTVRMNLINLCRWMGLGAAGAALWAGAGAVDVAPFGIVPDTRQNMTPAVRLLLKACTNGHDVVRFPVGRYDFWPDRAGGRDTAFFVNGLHGLELDGNGSTFVFHGLMMPFKLFRSADVTVRRVTIDWERPGGQPAVIPTSSWSTHPPNNPPSPLAAASFPTAR